MTRNVCTVQDCGKVAAARGLCDRHYRQWKRGECIAALPLRFDRDVNRRFITKTAQKPNGCIEWTGSKCRGYGRTRHLGRMVFAHRLAWEIENGALPPGMFVCHKCDNPACVNVDHLFLGTHDDNMGDAAAKGRMKRGNDHPRSRLTKQAVIDIRRRSAAGEFKKALAREFGVTDASVRQIVSRKTWKHISESEAA